MFTINIPEQKNVRLLLYPDSQPHVTITGIQPSEQVRVVAPIRSSLEMMQLLLVSQALNELDAEKCELVIPYLMGARSDRVMMPGDSFDLKVVADLVNSCGFKAVHLFDVHSPVACALIRNSKSHYPDKLVAAYDKPSAVLICPDKGATARVGRYLEKNPNLVGTVYCVKERDLSNGRITLKVLNPEQCKDRNCVIIDDLCDGGATFNAIAKQIEPAHFTLIISHGIFSKGFGELKEHFNHIICSDSFRAIPSNEFLTCIPLNL